METSSATEIWGTALGELQVQVSRSNYRTWFVKTVGLSYQDGQFVVGVPNAFVAEYLEMNQSSLIEKTLIGLTNQDIRVTFQAYTSQPNVATSYKTGLRATPKFNPQYTFDSFIIGDCNRLAHAAALGVAENPGHSYNPLFICGEHGLGKTHLLHALGHVALSKQMQVLYASAEQFTNEFIKAIRERKTEKFRNKYRNVDMLLVDDIDFICGKEQTEESFFHTFNELHDNNHQIAITSNYPPKSMPRLGERLRSRFEGGLITEIQPPDFETRLAILQAKSTQKGVNLAPDVLEYIAQRIQQNIRELEGSLNRVIAYAKLLKALVTPELAAQALESLTHNRVNHAAITPALVVEAVANSFQLTPSDLTSKKRDKETAFARGVAVYLLKQETPCSLAQIGQELGGRYPSTVARALGKIAAGIETNPYLKRKLRDIQAMIQPPKAPRKG